MYCQYLWHSLWSQKHRNAGKQKGKKMYPRRRSSCFQVISINKNLMQTHYHFPFQHRFASSRSQSSIWGLGLRVVKLPSATAKIIHKALQRGSSYSFGMVREAGGGLWCSQGENSEVVLGCVAAGWGVKQVMPAIPLVLSLAGSQRLQLEHISGTALPVHSGSSQTNICSPFCEHGTAEGLLEDGPNPNASTKASLLSVPALTWLKYCCHQ